VYRAYFSGIVILSSLIGGGAAAADCPRCEIWNQEQTPFRVFGNTYYVGPHGLSSMLIVSSAGHVLIDGALPESAPLIARHVEQLGFKMSDVKIILSSHVHYDHAGGIAELQKISGAKVIASDRAVNALRSGKVDMSDPQFGLHMRPYPGSKLVEALGARQSVSLGELRLNVIHTPGHTPGGTSWSWQSCEQQRCLNIVYADSLSAIADDTFKYSGDERYPTAAADMSASIKAIAAAPCDILVAAHPEAADLWRIFDEHGQGDRARLIDSSACKSYAALGQKGLDKRLAGEKN
jgi:metallo-beta-lactamase class B